MKRIKSYAMFENNKNLLEQMERDLRELTKQVFELSLEHIDEGGYLGYAMTVPSPQEGLLYHEEKPNVSIAKGMIDHKKQDIIFEYDSVDWVEQALSDGMKPAVWFYLLTENTNTKFGQEINFDHEKTEELKERALDELQNEWKGITIWIG
jgi:hypothetical protein